MSSMDIAELTGKQHSHVLRDIKVLLDQGVDQGVAQQHFDPNTYSDANGQSRAMYTITKEGIGLLATRYGSKPLSEISGGIVLVATRFEEAFMSKLIEVLEEVGISIHTQYGVDKYRLDAYIPSHNLAIEYDEIHHDYIIKQDSVRENIIKSLLGCSFIRLSYKDSDATNIGRVLNRLFN